MTVSRSRLGALVGTLALVATSALLAPAPVSACLGGMEFGWAVAHTQGWIAMATVVESEYAPVGFFRVALDDVDPVKGHPPTLGETTLAMGAVCNQTPDVGDRILVLHDIAIEPPYDTPVAYVIRGSDAIPAADVARVLSMPATDTGPSGKASFGSSSPSVPLMLAVSLAAAWVALRRSRRSTPARASATPSGPPR